MTTETDKGYKMMDSEIQALTKEAVKDSKLLSILLTLLVGGVVFVGGVAARNYMELAVRDETIMADHGAVEELSSSLEQVNNTLNVTALQIQKLTLVVEGEQKRNDRQDRNIEKLQ